LGLRITRSKDLPRWHEDVIAFEIRENGGDKSNFKKNDLVGHFYLDLFPRDGKFAHQMILPLSPSFVHDKSGEICRPAVSLDNFF
jgi:Zn-dependent oligopeptidase